MPVSGMVNVVAYKAVSVPCATVVATALPLFPDTGIKNCRDP